MICGIYVMTMIISLWVCVGARGISIAVTIRSFDPLPQVWPPSDLGTLLQIWLRPQIRWGATWRLDLGDQILFDFDDFEDPAAWGAQKRHPSLAEPRLHFGRIPHGGGAAFNRFGEVLVKTVADVD